MKEEKWYHKLAYGIGSLLLVPLLLPVMAFLLLSGLALYVYDKKNKGLDN